MNTLLFLHFSVCFKASFELMKWDSSESDDIYYAALLCSIHVFTT